MSNSNWRKHVANINAGVKMKKTAALRAAGHIPLKEAEESGKFIKLSWDMYKTIEDDSTGPIWQVQEFEGEKWLTVQTDNEGRIIRSLVEQAMNTKMQKTASVEKEALKTIPGDKVVIATPQQSFNRKYLGVEGEVVAGFPERSKLSFEDGYTLWVENKDLQLVRNASTLAIGDTIKMKKNTSVSGKIIGVKNDIIMFKSTSTGATFKTRLGEFDKITKSGETVFISTDDPKSIFKYLYPQPKEEGIPGGMPPAIKPSPSEDELKGGTAIPAQNLTMPQMAAEEVHMQIYGRVMNVGDRIVNKATGQEGTVEDIRVDRKLGKFYMVNYGGELVQEFETNLMKVNTKKEYMERPMAPLGEPYMPKHQFAFTEKIEKEAAEGLPISGEQFGEFINPPPPFTQEEVNQGTWDQKMNKILMEKFPEDIKVINHFIEDNAEAGDPVNEMYPTVDSLIEDFELYRKQIYLGGFMPNDYDPDKGIIASRKIKRAQGGPSLETLRGGGTSGPANVEPLTWEVHNQGEGGNPKDQAFEEALEEEMNDNVIGGNTISIEIDPVSKKFTIDFGDTGENNIEEEPQMENPEQPQAMQPPPGSPVQVNPVQGTPTAGNREQGGAPSSDVNF